MIATVALKASMCIMFMAYIDAVVISMDYRHRFMAMAVGGTAALFALFFGEPKTRREAMSRFSVGCVVAFTCTGHTLTWFNIGVTPDSVMMIALIWGSLSWSVLGGMVRWGESGGAFSTLARIVQGTIQKTYPMAPDVPSRVEQVKSIEENKGE